MSDERGGEGKAEAKAKPVKHFALPSYGDQKLVSSADYRGKVVMLSFWFPTRPAPSRKYLSSGVRRIGRAHAVFELKDGAQINLGKTECRRLPIGGCS